MGGNEVGNKDDRLAEHISAEILATIENTYLFRARMAFTVWIAPYVILGAIIIATKGEGVYAGIQSIPLWLAALAFASFIALGRAAGGIEYHAWERCNDLREILMNLSEVDAEKMMGPQGRNGESAERKSSFLDTRIQRLVITIYLGVFVALAASFVLVLVIAGELLRSAPLEG